MDNDDQKGAATCVFLSDCDHRLAEQAEEERRNGRKRLANTPSLKTIDRLLKGEYEAADPDDPKADLYCDTCGVRGEMVRGPAGTYCNVVKGMCRACLDAHCSTCLWKPPSPRPNQKGICPHCVFSMGEIGVYCVPDVSPDDAEVLALAKEDNEFMDYARRLGKVWDAAESKLKREEQERRRRLLGTLYETA